LLNLPTAPFLTALFNVDSLAPSQLRSSTLTDISPFALPDSPYPKQKGERGQPFTF
jgi:hypothetical protein